MGPLTLFDKSFLQSLSLDEAVWFDGFFSPVTCPIFFVETLADLAKSTTKRSPDTEVRIIADKTPSLHSYPVAFHARLATGNLLGHAIPMDSRVPISNSFKYVSGGGTSGAVFDESEELKAFSRWQDGKFHEVERLFASLWRNLLNDADLSAVPRALQSLGINGKSCKSLTEAEALAQSVTNTTRFPSLPLSMAVKLMNLPRYQHGPLMQAWKDAGQPSLSTFAPYAAYALTVEIYFHIALAAGLESSKRPSNRIDMAYLFYLPFCMMFVSSDKFHRRMAKPLLREDQKFIWGPDLKNDLKKINDHYSSLPETEREKGVMKLATCPPSDGDFLTTDLWNLWMPDATYASATHAPPDTGKDHSSPSFDRFKAFIDGETLPASVPLPASEDINTMALPRSIPIRKGSWYLLPKELEGQPHRER